MQAAIGSGQLDSINSFVNKRIENHNYLSIEGISLDEPLRYILIPYGLQQVNHA